MDRHSRPRRLIINSLASKYTLLFFLASFANNYFNMLHLKSSMHSSPLETNTKCSNPRRGGHLKQNACWVCVSHKGPFFTCSKMSQRVAKLRKMGKIFEIRVDFSNLLGNTCHLANLVPRVDTLPLIVICTCSFQVII